MIGKGRVAVVTGGSSGIGAMIAEGFVGAGFLTYIAARGMQGCVEVAERLGRDRCVPLSFDASELTSVAQLVEAITDRESAVDALVNCAGATWAAPLEEYPEWAFDRNWAVNVKTPYYLTVGLLPLLRAAATEFGHASVVNIGSSDGSLVPTWDNFAYSASKAALHHLTRHLAARLRSEDITVNCIAPGPFESRMSSFVFRTPEVLDPLLASVPAGRAGTQQEAAGSALFFSSSGGKGITGQVLALDGGWSANRF
jgi:NAD(P)-dependent dehydrogenase (short-subunit alcohol dehydrogenase family)